MSRPYSTEEKNWFCVCMHQRKSQKSKRPLGKALGKLRGCVCPRFLFDLEWWEAPAALIAWLLPRSGTQACAASVHRVEQMLPQPSYLFTAFRGAIHRAPSELWEQKNVTLRGAQSRRGPDWDGHGQWQRETDTARIPKWGKRCLCLPASPDLQ